MRNKERSVLYMHIAVLLWGVTAILGRLIQLREFILVWYRLLMVGVLMLFIPIVYKQLKQFTKKQLIQISFIGVLVALHWVCFYGAIKFANVSVALCALACTSFFTALIEPIVNRTPFNKLELILGVLVIPGLILINQAIPKGFFMGWVMGLLAALLAAIFTSYNKKHTQHTPALATVWLQLSSGAIFLTLLLPLYLYYFPNSLVLPSIRDAIYLTILVVGCTIVPYILYLNALKNSTAFATNLINNLEPIYGIVFAIFIFKEHQELNASFYIGCVLIFIIVFLHPLLLRIKRTS